MKARMVLMTKTLSELKARSLQSRLRVLIEQYEAANNQMSSTIDAVTRVRIEEQIRQLETEIQYTENELAQLTKHEVTGETQELPRQTDEGIPLELIDQVQKEDVVVFCGPGVSTSAKGSPGLEQLSQALVSSSNISKTIIYEVAQAYENDRGRNSLIRHLVSLIDDPTITPSPVHNLIASLPFKQIITTNWDNLLEQALNQIEKPFTKVVHNIDIAYTRERETMVIKLFGSIEQVDSIIITNNDLETLFTTRPRIFELIKSYFTTKALVFLGFELTDNTFERFYDEMTFNLRIHRSRAYIVQKGSPPSLTDHQKFQIINKELLEFLKVLNEMVKEPLSSSSSTYNVKINDAQGVAIGDQAQVSEYHTTTEEKSRSDIKKELIMYNRNLERLKMKTAMYGGAEEAPLSLLNQIDQEEAEIRRLETSLRELKSRKS
jgi:hypothetical protein